MTERGKCECSKDSILDARSRIWLGIVSDKKPVNMLLGWPWGRMASNGGQRNGQKVTTAQVVIPFIHTLPAVKMLVLC